MSDPVVFISHFSVKEGQLDALKRMSGEVLERLRAEKPRTVLFLSYLDEDAGVISFLHAFPDLEAMDDHFEGADQRSRAAYEFVEPRGWEIYGSPSARSLEALRNAAATAGVGLTVQPRYLGGFLRLAAG